MRGTSCTLYLAATGVQLNGINLERWQFYPNQRGYQTTAFSSYLELDGNLTKVPCRDLNGAFRIPPATVTLTKKLVKKAYENRF